MTPYVARRLLATIPVMAVVAVVVFMLLRLTTGDPAAIIAGDSATAQDVAAIRNRSSSFQFPGRSTAASAPSTRLSE